MSGPGRLSYPFIQAHPKNYGKGRQGYQDIWFCWHCTDDDYSDNYPTNLGHYWSKTPVQVSVHFAVSDTQTAQYVDMNDTAFQARNPGNLRAVGVELSGHKSWSRNEWLSHRRMLRRAAILCAQVATARGYKIGGASSRLDAGMLRARRSGITQHADLTAVFGGSHTDLGDHFPWDVLWGEIHRAYQPLAGEIATIAASRAAAQEEDDMAVSDKEFADLKNQVAQIHGAVVTDQHWAGSNLRTQLGYLGALVKMTSSLVESVLEHAKLRDAAAAHPTGSAHAPTPGPVTPPGP